MESANQCFRRWRRRIRKKKDLTAAGAQSPARSSREGGDRLRRRRTGWPPRGSVGNKGIASRFPAGAAIGLQADGLRSASDRGGYFFPDLWIASLISRIDRSISSSSMSGTKESPAMLAWIV